MTKDRSTPSLPWPMLRSVVCACVLAIGGGVVAGCGASSSKPPPPSMASLARTFIQHGHPRPPSYIDLVHYGWHVDPSLSHDPARDAKTLGEGGDPNRAHQGTREEFCHFYFIGTPTRGDSSKPPIPRTSCIRGGTWLGTAVHGGRAATSRATNTSRPLARAR